MERSVSELRWMGRLENDLAKEDVTPGIFLPGNAYFPASFYGFVAYLLCQVADDKKDSLVRQRSQVLASYLCEWEKRDL